MKKEIYKKVPDRFHTQLCRTLEQLNDAPGRSRIRSKKYVLILAAAILACASATVAAVGLMQWHGRASERFGTEKELEDQLTMKGAAVSEDAVIEEQGLGLRAIQAVRTDQYDYFLLQVTLSETLEWNEDILFEDVEAVGQNYGCVANFVSDSLKDHTVLLEIQLYPDPENPDPGEVCIRLKNLVQTEKTDITDCLMEGVWEISLRMPSAEADTVTFYPEQAIILGGHELSFTRAEVSPFQIRLYTDMDEALHAVWGHAAAPAGVWYKDGAVLGEDGIALSMSGHSDETGDFYFLIQLEQAVDPEQIAGILLQNGTEERKLFLDPAENTVTDSRPGPDRPSDLSSDTRLEDLQLLYVRYGNVILSDGQSVYLWDAWCGWEKELFSLEAYGYSMEDGGEIILGQGSQILLLPFAGSASVYLYDPAAQEMTELDAETFWPWPTYESYKGNVKEITEAVPEADEHYSGQAYASQGKLYYLYSENGMAEDMELRSSE